MINIYLFCILYFQNITSFNVYNIQKFGNKPSHRDAKLLLSENRCNTLIGIPLTPRIPRQISAMLLHLKLFNFI